MAKKYKKGECLILLQNKYKELMNQGENRYPKRSDFSDREVEAIKAFYGPWPRALEAAGVKPPRDDNKAERNRIKRLNAKRAKINALKNNKERKEEENETKKFII